MKIEVKFLILALVAILLAIPVSAALEHRADLLKVEKLKNTKLIMDLKTKQEIIDQKDQDKATQTKQIQDLQKQLQDQQQSQAETVEPAVAVIPTRPTASCASYRGLVSQYNWDTNVALAVMQAESSCNTNQDTTNDGHTICMGSRGLFQIGCDSTANYAGMFDPATNIAQAYALYSTRGWQPWSTYNTGAYLKFL